MRKTLTVLSILLFITVKIHSQTLPKAGDYIQDSSLNKFVGTWEYSYKENPLSLHRSRVIIELRKVKLLMPTAGFYYDNIIGVHTYIKNGTTIESSAPFNSTNNYSSASIMAVDKPIGTGQLTIKVILRDITKKKRIIAYLGIQPNNPNALMLAFREVDGIRINHEKGFTMPTGIVLTKK